MKKRCIKYIAALTAFGLASTAFAQYVWLDEKGVKQYSDVPPPASVPQNRVLKAPGAASRVVAAPPAPPAASPDKPPMTVAERNADFQKRRAEQAEKDKKDEEQRRIAANKAKNCERAGEYRRALESGQRIASTDQGGERTFMSDEQRERELQDIRRVTAGCR